MVLILSLLFACGEPASTGNADEGAPKPEGTEAAATDAAKPAYKHEDAALRKMFPALPEVMASDANPITPEKVALGRALYFDTRLSKNQDVSCNSCHQLDRAGVDGEPTSPGHKGQRGGRNSPTVYNAALHATQFWDGRAADVEAQAKGPILNPIEMAMKDEASVLAVLNSIDGYKTMFKAAFPADADPVTYDNLARAIGAFERTLVTPSRFDAWLAGDDKALAAEERAGLDLYVSTGCNTCHMGPALGGAMFQKLGLVHPYETADVGRMEVTKNESDKHMFKVPSLRNVADTGPYFHDGSIQTLEEAVKKMAHHQLGKDLSDAEVASIVTFLKSTSGKVKDPAVIAKPELPASGPDTPKPDPS